MIVSILRENLLTALNRTGRIISAKPQLPILQNVLLVVKDGELWATATNMETSETCRVAAKIEKDGGICVPSRLLTELVLTLPPETVRLVVKDGGLHLSCGGVNAVIPGVPDSEFPPVAHAPARGASSLEKELLIGTLNQVLFAAATDEGRPLLTGVKITKKEDEVVFAATDGYRLSVKRVSLPAKGDLDMVVPARALAEVVKVAQEEKEAKELGMAKAQEDNQLSFIIQDTEITTRLIEGEYPNFEKIIPAKHTTRVLVDKEELVRAVRSAAIFARDNANIVRMRAENQKIIVSANTPSVGENSVEVGAKVDGEGGDIAFNSRFLMEFLGNYTEEEILFEMTGSLNPGVFRPVKDESYLHIIMPVRVQG